MVEKPTCNMLLGWQNSCPGQCQASSHAVSSNTEQFSLQSENKSENSAIWAGRKAWLDLSSNDLREGDELPAAVLLRCLQLVHVDWTINIRTLSRWWRSLPLAQIKLELERKNKWMFLGTWRFPAPAWDLLLLNSLERLLLIICFKIIHQKTILSKDSRYSNI